MKKSLFFVLFFAFLFAAPAQAQMMGNPVRTGATTTSETQSETAKDEAAGKAVWDKLQDKQTTCTDLKDDDFDVLGDFFMGNMSGTSHDSMNQMMKQRLGDAGEKQMHIALGKRLSGCDANAALPQGGSYFAPMMGISGGMMGTTTAVPANKTWGTSSYGMMGNVGFENHMGGSFAIFHVVTWLAAMGFLVSGTVFFLKKIVTPRKK